MTELIKVTSLIDRCPNLATYWACTFCKNIGTDNLTIGDIKGVYDRYYIYTSINTQFYDICKLLYNSIDWDYVYQYYRSNEWKDIQ